MSTSLSKFLESLELGTPASFRNMTVIPLLNGVKAGMDYITLGQALAEKLKQVDSDPVYQELVFDVRYSNSGKLINWDDRVDPALRLQNPGSLFTQRNHQLGSALGRGKTSLFRVH